ncbi:GNAT family N-acetyltransferase [Actinoplanes sp. NPDC051859]|uniref:GNAT family N-acetyltransferase n=1 Tax=Actinoplanes sp. NPDC051859 TaxID=3363909 RepID=UPI00379FB9E5
MYVTQSVVRVHRDDAPSPAACDRLSDVVSAAYRAGDLVPGLPVADGVGETGAHVRAAVSTGRLLWVAEADGEIAGGVRAQLLPDGSWEVQRLAVDPATRHGGIGRALLDQLCADAAAAGAALVVLDAVVERGNPAFYARVGFRTVRHFPAADKPLSEVQMTRDPRLPGSPLPYPAPDDEPPRGATVSWWADDDQTWCRIGDSAAEVPGEPLGLDCLPGGDPDALRTVLAAGADAATGPDLRFDRPAGRVPAFVQPRHLDPALLAWWRSPTARRHR